MSEIEGMNMDNNPIIYQILQFLTETKSVTKCFIKISELFMRFVREEEFDDESMKDEFGDGQREDSFFMDWIADNYSNVIHESELSEIWNHLNMAYNDIHSSDSDISLSDAYTHDLLILVCGYSEKYSDFSNVTIIRIIASFVWSFFRVYNPLNLYYLSVDDTIRFKHLTQPYHPSIHKMLQIGKQNGDQPLLTYFVDAYNQHLISRKTRWKSKKRTSLNCINECSPTKFIFKKCKGLDRYLSEHSESEVQNFKELCSSVISIFCRQLLSRPPMAISQSTARIDDSIENIELYIFEAYSFVQKYISSQIAPFPFHIDLVIIPKMVNSQSYWNEYDGSENECEVNIGNIEQRLEGQHSVMKYLINWKISAQAMLQCVQTMIGKRTHQRVVIVIDRRGNNEFDQMFVYQTAPQKQCQSFESNQKFCNLSLFANSMKCVLPKTGNEETEIGICDSTPFGITLSFHCFAVDEVRVYLSFDGWCSRFRIADCTRKWFLPGLFVEKEQNIFRAMMEKRTNLNFLQKCQESNRKCKDGKYEIWRKQLLGN